MEITYTMQGDYLLPNMTLPEQGNRPIGLWGKQHLRYIERNHKIRYINLLTKCKLNDYLADIDEQAEKMYEQLVKRFSEQDGCTEQLKAANQMLWVRKMSNAAQRAREVVNAEVIYR
ncbi:MAG: TnpV protein [Ruminococcus sp.]